MPSLSRHHAPLLLELDLTQPLVEVEPEDPIGALRNRGKPRMAAVLRTLREAGSDSRVAGLIAKIGGPKMPLAIAQELRDAARTFASAGKPTVAWAETFGESGNGSVPYLLATGFGEIWLQPSGELNLLGVATEVTFLRGALDRLGIEPQIDKRYEFKNAADQLLQTEFTDAHREATDRLAASAWEGIVAAVAAARGLAPDTVRSLADQAPMTPAASLEAGLVDHCGYRDEAYAAVRRGIGGDVRLLFAHHWTPKPPLTERVRKAVTGRRAPVVALVEGHGAIVTGHTRVSPLDGRQLGSDTVCAALRAAREDDRVRAVLFRVDSPGGSYVASDSIWREVRLTRESGKPIVVSMGAVAGSGGYFVACPADVIVAQPATMTGSIGVFAGKPVITDLLDRLGLTTGAVSHGAHSRMFSPRVGFTDEERDRMSRWLDEVYEDFVSKVASGRGMTRDAVHEVARGRVWTGADASNNGLVDVIGGLHDAARIARERAGLPHDTMLRPAVHVTAFSRLRPPKSSADPRAAISAAAAGWGEYAGIASALGLPGSGPLTMAPLVLR